MAIISPAENPRYAMQDDPRSVEATIDAISQETTYEEVRRQAGALATPTWQRAATLSVAAAVLACVFSVVEWLLLTEAIGRVDAASVLWPAVGGLAFLTVGTAGTIVVYVWRVSTAPHDRALAHRIVAAEQTFAVVGIGTGGFGVVAAIILFVLLFVSPETYDQIVAVSDWLFPPATVVWAAVAATLVTVVNVIVAVVSYREEHARGVLA